MSDEITDDDKVQGPVWCITTAAPQNIAITSITVHKTLHTITYLPTYLSAYHLLTCLSIYQSYLSIYLPTYLPINLPTYLPSYHLLHIYLPIYLVASPTYSWSTWGSWGCPSTGYRPLVCDWPGSRTAVSWLGCCQWSQRPQWQCSRTILQDDKKKKMMMMM